MPDENIENETQTIGNADPKTCIHPYEARAWNRHNKLYQCHACGERLPLPGLRLGLIVDYVLANGEERPAIVVRHWTNDVTAQSGGSVNLYVLFDGGNDVPREHPTTDTWYQTTQLFAPMGWATSAHYAPYASKDDASLFATWHFQHEHD